MQTSQRMKSNKFLLLKICILLAISFDSSEGNAVTDDEWNRYKLAHGKTYPNSAGITEAYARYYYAYNKNLIVSHNVQKELGRHTYRLAPNKFSDMRFVTFSALFPQTSAPTERFNTSLPPPSASIPSFDPRDLGLNPTVSDQGVSCSSGWAYATAKAVEILKASEKGILTPPELSAQSLIDCAGQSKGCTTQHAQAAFDYLTQHNQELHLAQNYPNNNASSEPNVCIRPSGTNLQAETLNGYAYIPNTANADDTLKSLLPTHPVVIEYDPTSFQFMHYSEGVFQKPASYRGSHFLTVVGYGNDANTGKDYWLALNSFGNTWGENGYIKILRDSSAIIGANAIVPTN